MRAVTADCHPTSIHRLEAKPPLGRELQLRGRFGGLHGTHSLESVAREREVLHEKPKTEKEKNVNTFSKLINLDMK